MPPVVAAETRNLKKLPLGELIIDVEDDGVTVHIPALDKRWIQRSNFVNYVGLVVSGGKMKTAADLEEWMHESEWFLRDMEFLLHCKHHEFWSHMVFEKSALNAVVSFLQRANPFYIDVTHQLLPAATDLYTQILNCVLRIICRLITNKESSTAWLTTEHLRELLYTNFLLSIPMLLDLVVAVGDAVPQNAAILTKIFDTLFSVEPKYRQDLLAALAFFKTAFRTIQTQSENEGFDGAGGGAVDDNLETPFDDVVLYTLDCAYTLSILLEICPEVQSLCSDMQLGQSVAQFYDNTIPFLYKNIFQINAAAKSLDWLNMARVQFLRAFRSIVNSHLMAAVMEPEESILPAEHIVGLLTECLSERTFVIDYQREYPVELDMDILRQACNQLDNFKADFVQKGYQQEAETHSISMAQSLAPVVAPKSKKKKDTVSQANATKPSPPPATPAAPAKQRDLDMEVTAALDILPHLGTGFLRRVLQRYENSEAAIAAIFEENLPPDLVNADQMEVYIPADPQDTLFKQTGIKHYNVYDGDAYDIMTQDNPACIIKKGKGFPNAPRNAGELLDDKRDLQAIKHRYQEYSLVSDDVPENNEYDDEYDDSYEALLESETRSARSSKQLKAGLAEIEDVSEEEESESENEENANDNVRTTNGKRLDFCENPETIRARYEAKREAKRAATGGGRRGGGGAGGGNPSEPKSFDVKGAPKGQGQDKETLRNRSKKEAHKSSRANHNRKAGAAFKRNKGMMA